MAVWGGLTNTREKKRNEKQRRKRYKHLNAEFQRIARRGKKAFLSNQCKEIEKTTEWERLKAGGEGGDRWWDAWMASQTQGTRVWANSGRWWRTGKPGMLHPWDCKSRTWLSDWTTINGRYKRGVLREKWDDMGLASSSPWQSWAVWKQAHNLSFCYVEHIDWNHPLQPGTSNHLQYFMTGGPSKEPGTNKPPPTKRVWERSKGDTLCPTTSQNSSHWHPSWLSNTYATRKHPESEWLAKDYPETNPITIKPRGRATW